MCENVNKSEIFYMDILKKQSWKITENKVEELGPWLSLSKKGAFSHEAASFSSLVNCAIS